MSGYEPQLRLQHDAGVLLGTAGFGIGCHHGNKFGQSGLARDHTHLAFGITIVSSAGVQILVGAPTAHDISPAHALLLALQV